MPDSDPDALPDTIAPETPLPQDWPEDEYFLGAEAALPPGHYGPSIPSRFPDPSLQRRTLRELERRVRATLSPAFPLEVRRILPGAILLDRYRRYALRSRSLTVDEFGRDPAYCKSVEPALEFLYSRWLRVELRGVENIPKDRAAILVCNHTGALPYDASMLMHGLAREGGLPLLRPLLEDRVFQLPYLGVFLRRLGAVRACQENARRLLDRKALIAVFPEGHKAALKQPSSQHRLQRFGRGGFIRLALRSQAPILPVAIVAHPSKIDRALPLELRNLAFRMGIIPAPTRWSIVIGEAIDLSAEVPESEWEKRVTVVEEANRVRRQIRETIRELVGSSD